MVSKYHLTVDAATVTGMPATRPAVTRRLEYKNTNYLMKHGNLHSIIALSRQGTHDNPIHTGYRGNEL